MTNKADNAAARAAAENPHVDGDRQGVENMNAISKEASKRIDVDDPIDKLEQALVRATGAANALVAIIREVDTRHGLSGNDLDGAQYLAFRLQDHLEAVSDGLSKHLRLRSA